MRLFEVDSLKKLGKDWIFDVSVLPNRSDCMSHYGLAREITTINSLTLKKPATISIKKRAGDLPLDIRIKEKHLVPRYTAVVISGIQIKPSPAWLKNSLESLGINAINNVVDVTNFVMTELGQPLHAFDYDTIEGSYMNVRSSKQGEKIDVLDGQTISLPNGVIVIEDKTGVMDLAGIKGGKRTGITPHTKNIILQGAVFDQKIIYTTTKKLAYGTEASTIYRHGVDPENSWKALERACVLLQETGAGGRVGTAIDQYKPTPLQKISLDLSYVSRLLGIAVSQKEAESILYRLGFKITSRKGSLSLIVPSWRQDVLQQEDVIEEIGRIMGYEKIPSVPAVATLKSPHRNPRVFWSSVARRHLVEQGFTELVSYSFIGTGDVERMALTKQEAENLVEIEKPLSEDHRYLRSSIFDNMGKILATREGEGREFFEIGNIFWRSKKRSIEEGVYLGILLKDFAKAKGIIDALARRLGITEVTYSEHKEQSFGERTSLWQKGKTAEITLKDGTLIGLVGEISSHARMSWKISYPVVGISLNSEELAKAATEKILYQKPSRYPPVFRDIALFVPQHTAVSEVMDALRKAGEELVVDIELFDMYEGKNIDKGKKSLAFHIRYQSRTKTLKGEEVDAIHEKIAQIIEKNPLWNARR